MAGTAVRVLVDNGVQHRQQRMIAALAAFALVAGLAITVPWTAAPLTTMNAVVEDLVADTGTAPLELDELSATLFAELDGPVSDGAGIDVALIDTGVAPVAGLDGDNVLHGPDLSTDAGTGLATVDTYGHGTHLAGIIAGNRSGQEGVAPGARVVSVKVAGDDGATSLPAMIAAIDWVVANAQSDGLNVRVLNLSFGNDTVTTHVGDPLSAALERAWDAGIFVVVAAGNGDGTAQSLGSPAVDPYLMTVGGSTSVDGVTSIASWSQRGDAVRHPDVAAPGQSIASYRVAGSTIDEESPEGRHGSELFRGTGTSQSAAVLSGVAARLIGEHPELTPDQVKETFRRSAITNDIAATSGSAIGLLDVAAAFGSPAWDALPQRHVSAASGRPMPLFDWDDGTWNGATWAGATWAGATWAGATWAGGSWHGGSWHGGSWHGGSWH